MANAVVLELNLDYISPQIFMLSSYLRLRYNKVYEQH